jgi:hypothetical protein
MESLHGLLPRIGTMNRLVLGPVAVVLEDMPPNRGRRRATTRTNGRFMESRHWLLRTHWDHEPVGAQRAK